MADIDWSATGEWMQAWAGFAQAIIVGFAAWKAADTFNLWRKQKVEERRISSAIEVSSLIYRVRNALTASRAAGMTVRELEEATSRLLDSGIDLRSEPDTKRKKIIQAQVIFDRLDRFAETWNEMSRWQPISLALFGEGIEKALRDLWQEKVRIETAATHFPSRISDKELKAEIELTLSAPRSDSGYKDVFAERVNAIISEAELTLLPIIRHEIK